MRIAIMGSGGVGGYFGARLAQAGCDVAFIARGAHLAALRESGLVVESKLGNMSLPKVFATDDPATLGSVDLVIISVKLWDTEAAARAISPIVGPATSVLSLQNGVQKDDVLRHIIGDRPILGGDLLHLSDDRSARGNQPYRHRPEDRVRRIRRTTFGASRSFS